MAGGTQEIIAKVKEACGEYDFWSANGTYVVRRPNSGRRLERLVNDRWVRIPTPSSFPHRGGWRELGEDELVRHMRAFTISDLGADRLRLGAEPRERIRRSILWRWAVPPLDGGAGRRLGPKAIDRSETACSEELSGVGGNDLTELREEAQRGYQRQVDRCAGLEQRANFFLGAAGLTTSLVLANAGLLIGTGKLKAPWLGLGAGALGLASVCALVAGLRAMQAAMLAFGRYAPNSVASMSARFNLKGDSLVQAYVGALMLAQHREWIIGDWKLGRLRAARRWFLAVIVGVAALTAFVLAEAGEG